MKTMHWPPHLAASRFAFLARYRTISASTPMKVCAKPEPGIVTNGELKPVAIAFASIVFPVPGAPWNRMPRSRRPPARSNASPDVHRVTMRRTSSFASAWPRTSSSLTPQLASPGSKPFICEIPIIIIGPIRIRKLKRKKIGRMMNWAQADGFVTPSQNPCHIELAVPHQVMSPLSKTSWNRKTIVISDDHQDRRRGRSSARTSGGAG